MSAPLPVPDDLLAVVLARVRDKPGIVGLLLVGSAARGSMDPNSDWDFVGVVEDDIPWSRPYRDGGRETFAAPDGRQVELAFSSFSRLRRRITEQSKEGTKWTAEYLAEGSTIWFADSDDPLRQLQAEARSVLKEGPPPIPADDLAWRRYEIWNRVKDVDDLLDDHIAGYYVSSLAYRYLITLYFRLARIWLPHPKVLSTWTQQHEPALNSLCVRYSDATSNVQRHRILTEMMAHLSQGFGVEFERYYTSPPPDGITED